MQLIVFTKMLRGLSVEQIGERAGAMAFTGLDLAVRDGHAVNPGECHCEELPRAIKVWKQMKLNVPFVSLEAGTTDPHARNDARPRLPLAERRASPRSSWDIGTGRRAKITGKSSIAFGQDLDIFQKNGPRIRRVQFDPYA